MTPDELHERVSRIRKTVSNIKQALAFIEGECNLIDEMIKNSNQMQLWESEENVTHVST